MFYLFKPMQTDMWLAVVAVFILTTICCLVIHWVFNSLKNVKLAGTDFQVIIWYNVEKWMSNCELDFYKHDIPQ